MKLRIILALSTIIASTMVMASDNIDPEDELMPIPTISKKDIHKNPLEELDAAVALVHLYCARITTKDGRNSHFPNRATCRSNVMFNYMSNLLDRTAPKIKFEGTAAQTIIEKFK